MNHPKSLMGTRTARLGLLLAVWLTVAGAVQADPNLPMSYQPLGNAFLNTPGSDWAAVQAAAKAETTSQPAYKSNAVENVTFSGYFQATDNTTQLAILSDDGADVYIDGQKVVSGYQAKQALPDLSHSLTQIGQTFDPTHIYNIQIVYSNVILTGPDDIDGVTLFCYGGGGSLVNINTNFQVRRTGSGNTFGSSAVIAAGTGGVSQADVQVVLTNSDGSAATGLFVDAPTLANEEGASLNGSISPAGQSTDSNGVANFTYHASDQVTTDYTPSDPNSPPPSVTLNSGSVTATISQHWNDVWDGSEWGGDQYFSAGSPATVTFTPQFMDNTAGPITGHTIHFVITSVQVTEYDPNTNGDVSTIYSTTDPSDPTASPPVVNVPSLSQYVSVSSSAGENNGVYSSQYTVTDENIDSIEIEVEDDGVFGE